MDILDTQAQSRARFWKGPLSTTAVGRSAIETWLPPLAAYLATMKPPRGLEQVLRGLTDEQLAFLALRALLNKIYGRWGLGPDRAAKRKRRKPPNPALMFCIELGRMVRDELEFAALLGERRAMLEAERAQAKLEGRKARKVLTAADRIVAAGKPSKTPKQANRAKRAALGKFRRIDWTNAECARVGDWLIKATEQMDCFTLDDEGLPTIAPDHKPALDELAEKLVFMHPLYMPSLVEPPPWRSWRTEYDDRISATFVRTTYAETAREIQAAFKDDSIRDHALGVSAIQRVPLKINLPMLDLLRRFGGEQYSRDVAIAEALGGSTFWTPISCDFRGRLVHLCDFNYTRGDPVRALFMFAEGKPIGSAINWLEIAVANAFGAKGTWRDRHEWVADNRPLIKAVAANPNRIWQDGDIKPKEPFAFAAACMEYIAADHCGPEYVTHLPVWLDASSNGLQHLAMMRRDEELASWVNLDRGEFNINVFECDGRHRHVIDREASIRDIYQIVAERVRLNLLANRDDPAASYWLQYDLRDLLKRPIMTLPYGAGEWGMFDQIAETCEDLGIAPDAKAIAKLRDHVWQAIQDRLPGAVGTMRYIQGIDKRCLDRGLFMAWTTPTGFRVCNRYLKSKTRRVELPFSRQKITIADDHLNKPRQKKTLDSAVANVVHSMDASHLIWSVNAAVNAGITNVLTIHDCYATTAPDTDEFKNIRRSELARMYHQYNPLERLRENDPKTKPIELGMFDPLAAAFSEYFDR